MLPELRETLNDLHDPDQAPKRDELRGLLGASLAQIGGGSIGPEALMSRLAALISRHWAVVVLAAGAVAAFYVHTLKEERDCLGRFGEAVAAYCDYRTIDDAGKVTQENNALNTLHPSGDVVLNATYRETQRTAAEKTATKRAIPAREMIRPGR